jgi:hypothetical protein
MTVRGAAAAMTMKTMEAVDRDPDVRPWSDAVGAVVVVVLMESS